MRHQFVLVGGGGLARELAGWLHLDGNSSTGNARGYLSSKEEPAMVAYGLPWLGTIEEFDVESDDRLVLAIGDPTVKSSVVALLALDPSHFTTFVHPSAVIHPSATLGNGVIIFPLSAVSADAVVEDFVTVNLLCTVGHDTRIGSCSTLSAHVDLTGRVKVGASVFFGSGARVLPDIVIGAGARIGAGATVVRTVPDGATVYTAPAKRL